LNPESWQKSRKTEIFFKNRLFEGRIPVKKP